LGKQNIPFQQQNHTIIKGHDELKVEKAFQLLLSLLLAAEPIVLSSVSSRQELLHLKLENLLSLLVCTLKTFPHCVSLFCAVRFFTKKKRRREDERREEEERANKEEITE
jgi:hypothetical protein